MPQLLPTDPTHIATHSHEWCVLVADLCGFSRFTQEHGLGALFAQVNALRRAAQQAIAGLGKIIKYEGDNVYALVKAPADALAIAKYLSLNAPPCSIGLAQGMVLETAGDLWGEAVNTACRLGEDIGQAGQILASVQFLAKAGADINEWTLGHAQGLDYAWHRPEGRP